MTPSIDLTHISKVQDTQKKDGLGPKPLNINSDTQHAALSSKELLSHAPLCSDTRRALRLKEVLADLENMPSLPTIVSEVVKLAGDGSSEAKDFEEPFRKDQAMTAKVLKLVNSSFYALPSKVTTVQRAIVVLGYKTIKSLVLACSASSMLSRPVAFYGYAEGGLWKHSLATAALARYLGITYFKKDTNQAEELFVAGLLHDVGKIALVPHLNKLDAEIAQARQANPAITITQVEHHLLGMDHCEAGSEIASRWKLDENLINTIKAHHHSDVTHHESNIVTFADILATRTGVGLSQNAPWKRPIPPHLIETLGLEQEQIHELKTNIKHVIQSSLDMLESLK